MKDGWRVDGVVAAAVLAVWLFGCLAVWLLAVHCWLLLSAITLHGQTQLSPTQTQLSPMQTQRAPNNPFFFPFPFPFPLFFFLFLPLSPRPASTRDSLVSSLSLTL